MKLRYNFLSIAIICSAMIGFTSCDDDEPALDPVNVIVPNQTGGDYQITSDVVRVKVGEENRVTLPVSGGSDIRGFSLDETIAKVIETPSGMMLEGVNNGSATIMVTDAGSNVKQFIASVYTTDVLQLNKAEVVINAPLGEWTKSNECAVALGNGGYTATSDNEDVTVSIDPDSEAIEIMVKGRMEEYTATITVKDMSDLSAILNVTVTPSKEAFSQQAIDDILALKSNDVWAVGYGIDQHRPSYFSWSDELGTWLDTDKGALHQVGWWWNEYGSDYGGIRIEYPVATTVGEEVEGTFYYQYDQLEWYELFSYPCTVKVLEDSDKRKVVIAWSVDLEHECNNKAYVVYYK